MNSLVIKTPNWMGDILFSLDLLYSLSFHFDRLGICVSKQHAELFSIFPVPNSEIIEYEEDQWPNLDRETISRIGDFEAEIGLMLPNSIGSALIFRYAGVPRLYGYNTEHRGLLLSRSIPPPKFKVPQTEYYLNLLSLFELPAMEYPREQSIERRNLVIFHPGASKLERAWPVDRFGLVSDYAAMKGFEVLFISGEKMKVNHPLLIKPSLSEFSALLKQCRLFVGNDSGPLHLAQQCGAPVLGIYGPGDPNITGPRPITPSRVVWHSYPCSPCRQRFFKECDPAPSGKPYCIETIGSPEVISIMNQLLFQDPFQMRGEPQVLNSGNLADRGKIVS